MTDFATLVIAPQFRREVVDADIVIDARPYLFVGRPNSDDIKRHANDLLDLVTSLRGIDAHIVYTYDYLCPFCGQIHGDERPMLIDWECCDDAMAEADRIMVGC